MKIKKFRSICSVMGCRNTDTYLISRNSVTINTPNICKECLKMAYLEMFPEDASSTASGSPSPNVGEGYGETAETVTEAVDDAVDEAVDDAVDETENTVEKSVPEVAENAVEEVENDIEVTEVEPVAKKKTRKRA